MESDIRRLLNAIGREELRYREIRSDERAARAAARLPYADALAEAFWFAARRPCSGYGPVVVASPSPGSGCTTVACALAAALRERGVAPALLDPQRSPGTALLDASALTAERRRAALADADALLVVLAADAALDGDVLAALIAGSEAVCRLVVNRYDERVAEHRELLGALRWITGPDVTTFVLHQDRALAAPEDSRARLPRDAQPAFELGRIAEWLEARRDGRYGVGRGVGEHGGNDERSSSGRR